MGFSDVIQVTGNFGKPHTPATSYMVEFYFHTHPINEPIDLFSYHNKTMSLEKNPKLTQTGSETDISTLHLAVGWFDLI